MSSVLQDMASLQGYTKIGGGQYDVDNLVKEYLAEKKKDQE